MSCDWRNRAMSSRSNESTDCTAARFTRSALRMVGDPSDAEDLTQEVFLQLFRKINTFRGESAFSTWLHRMAVNIVLMRFRKKNIADQSLEAITNPEEGASAPSKEFGAA